LICRISFPGGLHSWDQPTSDWRHLENKTNPCSLSLFCKQYSIKLFMSHLHYIRYYKYSSDDPECTGGCVQSRCKYHTTHYTGREFCRFWCLWKVLESILRDTESESVDKRAKWGEEVEEAPPSHFNPLCPGANLSHLSAPVLVTSFCQSFSFIIKLDLGVGEVI
jgi:hypothetical protein